jgi:hypothetical protein
MSMGFNDQPMGGSFILLRWNGPQIAIHLGEFGVGRDWCLALAKKKKYLHFLNIVRGLASKPFFFSFASFFELWSRECITRRSIHTHLMSMISFVGEVLLYQPYSHTGLHQLPGQLSYRLFMSQLVLNNLVFKRH